MGVLLSPGPLAASEEGGMGSVPEGWRRRDTSGVGVSGELPCLALKLLGGMVNGGFLSVA